MSYFLEIFWTFCGCFFGSILDFGLHCTEHGLKLCVVLLFGLANGAWLDLEFDCNEGMRLSDVSKLTPSEVVY